MDVLTFIKGGVSDSGERPVQVFDDYLSPQLLTAPLRKHKNHLGEKLSR